MKNSIRLVRYDLQEDKDEPLIEEIPRESCPLNRNDLLSSFQLAEDSVVKLNFQGKLIPWSLVGYISSIASMDFQVFRPHQNIKPKHHEDFSSDGLIREKVYRLESRISSLETSMDETTLQQKTERDLQLLTKQISFLAKRLDEADRAEWIKKE